MADILETIVAHKRIEVAEAKERLPEHELYRQVEALLDATDSYKPVSLSAALRQSAAGIIAEFKRRSPSRGWINEPATPEDVVPAYEQAGAAACSVLTDTEFFGGSQQFLQRVRPQVKLPLLRKDFIIDEYQLFEARLIGADAVLLIAADLKLSECRSLIATAHELGLETLLEIHSESELNYCELDTDLVGVNNRNLGTFVTDVQNSFRLINRLPRECALVSESGISDPQTIRLLHAAGYNGFLIGDTFMRTADPAATLQNFIAAI